MRLQIVPKKHMKQESETKGIRPTVVREKKKSSINESWGFVQHKQRAHIFLSLKKRGTKINAVVNNKGIRHGPNSRPCAGRLFRKKGRCIFLNTSTKSIWARKQYQGDHLANLPEMLCRCESHCSHSRGNSSTSQYLQPLSATWFM